MSTDPLFARTGFAYQLMGVSFAGLVPTAFCPGPLCWMYRSRRSPATPATSFSVMHSHPLGWHSPSQAPSKRAQVLKAETETYIYL